MRLVKSARPERDLGSPEGLHVAAVVALLLALAPAGGCGNGKGGASGPLEPSRAARVGALLVEVEPSPPRIRFLDDAGRTVTETAPGILRIAEVETREKWFEAFLAVERNEETVVDFGRGSAEVHREKEGLVITLSDETGQARASLFLSGAQEGAVLARARPIGWRAASNRDSEIHFRFAARENERFYGFGGQTDAAEHRGHTIPVRVTEQGLTKDPDLAESAWSIAGHLHDAYFPLPYVVVARPGPDHAAYGLVLESDRRSRFLLCSEEDDILEIQAQLEPQAGPRTAEAWLYVLPGPSPREVVSRYTAIEGRPQPVPAWAFGPWVAIKGEPLEVAALARALEENDIAATAVWDQDWRNYDHPDLAEMAARVHEMGLQVLTYFNTFLDSRELEDPEDPIARGFAPERANGGPYRFLRVLTPSSIVDLTDEGARQWMADRMARAYRLGVDGWMADYGEWVAPDMMFQDGRTGRDYANRYCVDWAALNDEVARAERPDGGAVFFSRSGYLGSNRYARVIWAGDQQTDWDLLDGLPSVIPYGTSLGLAGVSAFGFDIAGYTGIISPPSTKELYLRWLALGALSPVMRTHRGNNWQKNWNWDSDGETIAEFRRYSLLHLRLLPYLQALHEEAVRTGLPAMRHVLLEFPGWEGAPRAHHVYMLGPSLFVAPVIRPGVATWEVELPPGGWYRWQSGDAYLGPAKVTVPALLGDIPVFLRTGGIVPMLPESVRRVETVEGRPPEWSVREVESRALEIDIGSGQAGRMALGDGTEILVIPLRAADSPTTTVRIEGASADLRQCDEGMSPYVDPCWAHEVGGAVVTAARTGPGGLFFSRSVAGADTWVRVVGGPAERHVTIRLFHLREGRSTP